MLSQIFFDFSINYQNFDFQYRSTISYDLSNTVECNIVNDPSTLKLRQGEKSTMDKHGARKILNLASSYSKIFYLFN